MNAFQVFGTLILKTRVTVSEYEYGYHDEDNGSRDEDQDIVQP